MSASIHERLVQTWLDCQRDLEAIPRWRKRRRAKAERMLTMVEELLARKHPHVLESLQREE